MKRALLSLCLSLSACGVSNGVVGGDPGDPKASGGKALLDVNGPDISIDQAQLQASIQVVTNASVSQAEVDEGCAAALNNRTLIRFDTKTPNNGPGDFHVGNVSCKSTLTTASCNNVDCFQNPSCCCGGTQQCTATGGSVGGQYFEFSCAHSHIHYKSFANYRLLAHDGTVAATGHKQSFCLMDLAGIAPGSSCNAAGNHYGCGDQGIHPGCADIYSSALPCAFVDATDVPNGDYTLEVTMDPLDAINEANETNNVQTAQVHLTQNTNVDAGTTNPDAGTPLFLVRRGVGSEQGANAYYASNIAGFTAGSYTLDQWKQEHLGLQQTVGALYRNRNELGFWREMTCTAAIDKGLGGCTVTNWANADDKQNGLPNKGTVAMAISSLGYTEFFVFLPDGHLSPFAILDSEGQKYVPNLCTTCHGGEYAGNGAPDLGSIWREFEPSLLQPLPGLDPVVAEQQWYDLNQSIKQANAAIRSEAQGSPFGTDFAKSALLSYLDEIYSQTSPPVSRPIGDLAHVPPSWSGGATPQVAAAKVELYEQFVAPYCMSCHRALAAVDYANYPRFEEVSANLGNGDSLLKRYIHVDPNDPLRHQLPFMPQAQLQFENLQNDATALIAVDTWLSVANQRPPNAVIAGAAQRTATAGEVVSLDASGSSSPDALALSFTWEVLSGPQVMFTGATAATNSFVVPPVTVATAMTVRLRVRDTNGAEGDALVAFTLNPPPPTIVDFEYTGAPIAIPDNNPTGAVANVDVSDGRQVVGLNVQVDITHTYIGDLVVTLLGPNGFQKVLSDRQGRNTHDIHQTFAVPEAAGSTATGTWRLSVVDTAQVDVGTIDHFKLSFAVLGTTHAPVARIAQMQTTIVTAGDTVALDGSGSSSPDSLPLNYTWDVTTGTPLQFSPSAVVPQVSFVAPSVSAQTNFVVRLRVTDSNGQFSDATASITVKPLVTGQLTFTATGLPLAIPDNNPTGATANITVTDNQQIASLEVKADITHTYDGDLALTLKGPGGFEKVLRNHTGGAADNIHESYTVAEAAGLSTAGTWSLLVVDGAGADVGTIDGFQLTIGTNGASQAPTAAISASVASVESGQGVTLTGTGTSPAGLALTYLWDVTAGPAVVFNPSSNLPTVSFTAPPVVVDTQLTLRLRVTDSQNRTGEATVQVLVKPNMSLQMINVASADTPLAIPDNNATGIVSTLNVTQMQTIATLSVTVDITHTYIGDLTVTLVGPNGFTKVLHNRAGGSADNIHQTYVVPEAVGLQMGGAWQLKVVDGAAVDVGTLDDWKMTLQ